MELVKQGGVMVDAKQPAGDGTQEFIYKCPMDGGTRDTPGPCPICKMPLDDRHKMAKAAPAGERTIYVCDVHPEDVSDKPGQCFKDT